MEIRTTGCSEHGRPEFLIRCDDSIPAQDLELFVSFFEQSVRGGVVFQNGETIQLGWMLSKLSATDDGTLLLMEPDMRAFPIQWTPGATETLRQLRLQKDTADSVGLGSELHFPSIRDSAILGVDVDANTRSFLVERADVVGNDSGWFIGNLQSNGSYDDPQNLRRASLYEVAILCPEVVMFMALPVATRVEFSGRDISISRDGAAIEPKPGSFLGRYCGQ